MTDTPDGASAALVWLREELRGAYRRTFELIDADGDGRIDADELARAYELHGRELSRSRATELLSGVGDGDALDFGGFLRLLSRSDVPASIHDEVALCFHLFDRDADGRLDAHELHRLLEATGGEFEGSAVQALVAELDTDGDAGVSLPELFAAVWPALRG